MFTAWSVCVILSAAVFSAGAASFDDDEDILIEAVKGVVNNINNYIEDHNLEHIGLPNIGLLPIDPLKLRNGQLGKFSTIELQDVTFINQTKMTDGTVLFSFDILLGLKEFRFEYDFILYAPLLFNQNGHFSLSPMRNSIQVTGKVSIKDKTCDAMLGNIRVAEYGHYKIQLEPNNMPYATQITEDLMNFVSPLVLPITNKVIQIAAYLPPVNRVLSSIVCRVLDL
nr:uncharacterized protein LOC106685504 [Halyomorpha halys]